MIRKKRKSTGGIVKKSTSRHCARLRGIRHEFQDVIAKLKALNCEDSTILIEFWHALDRVNGDEWR